MIAAPLVEATLPEQLCAWSVLLALLIVALAFGAWREEQRRIEEEMERRRRIKEKFPDVDP